jgi:3-methyl-2-oxobutanoate hydroxymethyltransferase
VSTSARAARDGRACTVPQVLDRKGGERLVMVTAYDFATARMADRAGVDLILVGDSVAMAFGGRDDTLSVTVEQMAYHVTAVAAATPSALVVGDMPWLSYHMSLDKTVDNAAQLIRAGAAAVKLEGGAIRAAAIRALVEAEIPVMGHLGLTPQSINRLGGFRTQGRSDEGVEALLADGRAIEEAGCFSVVLEAMPAAVGAQLSSMLTIPTIGIGAGPGCDGQILLIYDLLGLEDRFRPKFVRRYACFMEAGTDAVGTFVADVRSGNYPGPDESY